MLVKKIGLHDISWITVIKSWNRGFMTGTHGVYAVCQIDGLPAEFA
jgi:hypothetical protein